MLGPAELRALADRLGLRPTKRLGQNFVHDANTVRRIVAAANLVAEDVVLEIGPGLGSLTLALLGVADRVLALEVDPLLAGALPATVAARARERADGLRVLTADALRTRRTEIVEAAGGQQPTVLVANLPYNTAVPVLLHLLAELPSLRGGLVMVQAEVADRLAAPPGTRCYGVPSVKAAWFADVRRAGPVPRAVFWPVPKVDSALVRLIRRPLASTVPRERVFALVDAAFAQRRKTLRTALAPWAGSADAAERVLRAAGVDPSARGEQLTVGEFARIAREWESLL
ncbi:MAG: 16S rRNA (adenine(1518)-N(6)/adenine(1519)-N(6))-dimethyltransferase RsmA [Pseudonocardiales bacterium]|nr:16S rRNA (adenine(1518)-N(6)/adenine(1519)-N(6))-dimethyltransferase RsmA [Pseudonocardiales bacterium]MBV9164514.1 16S rRNA (adenine(1518)-N(6)/adenine(1519)-N(6))-dimethyltransferase RsmA [Pseudonocardiales bacterium]